MKKNNLKVVKIDKNKSLFNYEKKVLINDLILNLNSLTINSETTTVLSKCIILFMLLLSLLIASTKLFESNPSNGSSPAA